MAIEPAASLNISLFDRLRVEFGQAIPTLRCCKATLVHLSHTIEDLVISRRIPAWLFTGFQESSHWREETERYRALAAIAQQVCIFAGAPLPPESSSTEVHVTLRGDDPLRQEWFVVLLSAPIAVVLCGQDRQEPAAEEAARQFDTLWSFDPAVIARVLDLLEQVIAEYRPERLPALQEARAQYPLPAPDPEVMTRLTQELIRYEEEIQQQLMRTSAALAEQLRWHDDLTATLVHDMRSPLQGVKLALAMLQDPATYDPGTLTELLQIAQRSATNLDTLMQLILNTNQLAAGELTVSWQPIQPAQLLAEALEPLQQLANSNRQTISTQVDERVRLLWADQALLSRMIQNLVGNALKFMPAAGTVMVAIAAAPGEQAIELRVRDTGPGIPPDLLPRVFERYYRAGDRRGTGLGLYFCRLAAEAHRGSIRVASRLGGGTTFTIVLPATPPL